MSTEFKEFSAKKTQANVFDILISADDFFKKKNVFEPTSKTGARYGLVLPGNMDKKKKAYHSKKVGLCGQELSDETCF